MTNEDTAPRVGGSERGSPSLDLSDTVISATNIPLHLATLRATESVHPVIEQGGRAQPLVREKVVPDFYYRIGNEDATVACATVARFGRRPVAPRIPQLPRPTLVPVASPRGEISTTHVEIAAVGSSVVVTDLKSSNGTVLRVPGRISRTLRGGESVVVPRGSVIDLGDGILIHILPDPYIQLPEGTE